MAPATFGHHLAAIRFFYTHVIPREFPILAAARPRRQDGLPDVLSVAEVHALLHAVHERVLFVLSATLYACGLRRSEGVSLGVGDLDPDRRLVRGRGGKGGRDRFVPLPGRLQQLLDGHLQAEAIESGLVFRSRVKPGQAVAADTVAKALRAAAAEALPGRYFRAIVTVPSAYSLAVRERPRRLAGELMEAVAEALQQVAGGRHGPGGQLGILVVLHTWGRNLGWPAHVHCLIPGVVLHAEGTFARIATRFLVPIRAFREVLRAILTRRFRAALPGFDPPGQVWRTPWNVQIRPCDEGPRTVLKYLTRYVRSGPLHESQIVQADDTQVAFRYLDHRSGTVQVWRGLPSAFVARYLQHALPYRFHRIRHYGFHAPGRRRDLRALQVALIARYRPDVLAPTPAPRPAPPPQPCPHCGSTRPRLRTRLPPSRPTGLYDIPWRAPPAASP